MANNVGGCDIKTKAKKRTKKKITAKKITVKDIATAIAEVLDGKKAVDVKVMDVRKVTSMTDFLVISTAESSPQIKAISSAVEEKLLSMGEKPMRWEGIEGSNWMILDIGNIIVHVMGEAERERYDLEGLFGKKAIVYHL